MVLVNLHLGGGASPARFVPIDLGPLGIVDFAWSHGGERQESQRVPDQVSEAGIL